MNNYSFPIDTPEIVRQYCICVHFCLPALEGPSGFSASTAVSIPCVDAMMQGRLMLHWPVRILDFGILEPHPSACPVGCGSVYLSSLTLSMGL